jgi:hypothetical protein
MGFCILSVSEGEVTGNPAEVPGCVVIRRTQETLMAGQSLEMAMDNQGGSVQIYCAIFSLDGTFIMADIDTAGSGKVTCP